MNMTISFGRATRHSFQTSTMRAAALAAIVAAAPAAALEVESHYTSTADKDCRTVEEAKPGEGEWVVLACPGRAGYVVRITEDDLRTTVSAGRSLAAADREPAASQGFPPFNRIGDTLEWRGIRGGPPFALIHRWFLSDSQNPGPNGRPPAFSLIVVTRLPPGPICHVAYVDVRANKDSNMLARRAADELAGGFRCGEDEIRVVGERGRAVELAGL